MKSNPPLWRLSIATSLEAEDAVTELAGRLIGQPASAYFNVETGVSVVSVYFSDRKLWSRQGREQMAAGLQAIQDYGVATQPGKITCAKVKREDWAESWKRHFQPMEIGDSLLIKPSWSKKRPRKNQAVVVLDPGLSFGTGQHATTSFCLAEIVRCRRPDARQAVLDIGTGSGILAIAAAKLGYRPVHAFDFDPESVRISRANAQVNGLANRLRITRGDVTKLSGRVSKPYDLICANLISNLLISERRRIVNRLAPGGTLVLAGILAAEFSKVQAAFAGLGLRLITSRLEKEWRSGSFQFKKL
jgi:ribosomal protein L11 methyltransferase